MKKVCLILGVVLSLVSCTGTQEEVVTEPVTETEFVSAEPAETTATPAETPVGPTGASAVETKQ